MKQSSEKNGMKWKELLFKLTEVCVLAAKYSVSLKKILKDFNTLETLYLPDDPEKITQNGNRYRR